MPLQLQVRQTGLEKSIQEGMKKAGRNLKLNLGNTRNIDALSQPLGRLTGKADEFTKSMEAANARVLAFGASVGVIAAVTKGMQELVRTTIEVEKSMAGINSILRQTDAQMSTFKDTLFDVARNTEQTFASVAEAALELSRQGLKAEEVTKRLNDALVLSRLSGLSAADSVSGLTAAINSFSKSGITSAEVLNKISAAAASAAVSDRDLIEGLKRSGAVAVSTGVGFDKLLGIIGALQEKTARGGAVIGNSLKTIFTRIQDVDRLKSLQNLGVQVTDLQGNVLSADKVIENLAPTFAKLDQASKVNLADNLVGKFQIAPFLSLLEQYNEEVVRSNEIAKTSFGATNEAYERNIALNNTLSAALNSAVINMKELGNTLGEIGVTDNLKNVLNFFNSIAESLQGTLDGEGAGSTFAKGLVKGIGAILSGPGLVLLGAVVTKLAFGFVKFGTSSLKTFFGLNQAAKEQANLQGQITAALLNDSSIRQDILHIENKSISVEEKRKQQAEAITAAMNAQLQVMQQMQSISKGITPSVAVNTKAARSKSAAGGFLPIGAESSDIARGVGGAPSSAKPVVIPNFAFGGGKRGTMVANSSEYIVPNYANGGDAIFNQNMASSMGLPANAKKVRAASGYIPNFAKPENMNMSAVLSKIGGKRFQEKLANGKLTKEDKAILARKDKLEAAAVGKRSYMANSNPKSILLVPNHKVPFNLDGADHPFQSPYASKLNGEIDFFEGAAAGIDPDLKNSESEDARKLSGLVDLDDKIAKNLAKGVNDIFSEFKNAVGFKTDPNVVTKDNIKDTMESGGPGAFGAIKGATFEALMQAISGGVSQKAAKGGGELDVVFSRDQSGYLETVFGIKGKGYKFADFKNSLGQKGKYVRQVVDNVKGNINVSKNAKLSTSGKKGNAASGYIPNFADPLQDAIGREQAAGLPVSQIRINQSGKLRNSQNPMGLAVTNTRDEPTGAIPNFAEPWNKGVRKSDVMGAGFTYDKKGVEDFNNSLKKSTRNIDNNVKGQRDLTGIIFGVQAGMTALSAATGESTSTLGKYTSIVSGSMASASSFVFAGQAASQFGENMKSSGGKFKGAMGGIIGGLGVYGAAVMTGMEVFKLGKDLYQEYSGANDRAAQALAHLKDASEDLSFSFKNLSESEKLDTKKEAEGVISRRHRKILSKEAAGLLGVEEQLITRMYKTEEGEAFENDTIREGFVEVSSAFLALNKSAFEVDQMLEKFGVTLTKVELAEFTDSLKIMSRAVREQEKKLINGFDKFLGGLSDEEFKSAVSPVGRKDLGAQLMEKSKGLTPQQYAEAINKRRDPTITKDLEDSEKLKRINDDTAKARIDSAIKIKKAQIDSLNHEERNLQLQKALGSISAEQEIRLNKKIKLQELDQKLASSMLDMIKGQSEKIKGLGIEEAKVQQIRETILESDIDRLNNAEEMKGVFTEILTVEGKKPELIQGQVNLMMELVDGAKLFNEELKKGVRHSSEMDRFLSNTKIYFESQLIKKNFDADSERLSGTLGIKRGSADIQRTEQSLNQRLAVGGLSSVGRANIRQQTREGKVDQAELNRKQVVVDFTAQEKKLEIEIGQAQDNNKLKLQNQLSLLKDRNKINMLNANLNVEKARREADAPDVEMLKLQASIPDRIAEKYGDALVTSSALKDNLVDSSYQFMMNMDQAFRNAISGSDSLGDALLEVSKQFLSDITSAYSKKFLTDAFGGMFGSGLRNEASGGYISGGSGHKDDVPAMLMGGEFVIRKSAVQKYGAGFFNALNNGGVQGYASGGSVRQRRDSEGMFRTPSSSSGYISGASDLMSFATQSPNRMGGDSFVKGGATAAFLDPESARLSMFGRRNSQQFEQIQGAKRQAFDLAIAEMSQEDEARRASKKSKGQFLKDVLAAGLSAGLGYKGLELISGMNLGGLQKFAEGMTGFGANLLGTAISGGGAGGFGNFGAGAFKAGGNYIPLATAVPKSIQKGYQSSLGDQNSVLGGLPGGPVNSAGKVYGPFDRSGNYIEAYADLSQTEIERVRGYATGGMVSSSSGVDTVPTMLSGGEFVMNAATTKRLGAGNLQALNSGSGGGGDNSQLVGKLDELISATEDATGGEINITINSEGKENVKTSEGASEDQKRLSERIKTVVKQVITDEKRLGGQLRK